MFLLRHLCAVFILSSMIMCSFSICYATNTFNPYIHEKLPTPKMSSDTTKFAKSLGGRASSLQEEVQHRPYWKAEVYPIIFGSAKAKHEILVFLDYASAYSENLWREVVQAAKSLNPQNVKIVVFAKSAEAYGTDLMGGGIWMAHIRPESALDYFTFTLRAWNVAKEKQKAKGQVRLFIREYDAVGSNSDYPILYDYLYKVRPSIPSKDHVGIAQYAFNAGNVNGYQAELAADYYDITSFPAIVIDGDVLKKISAGHIVKAVQ